MKEYQEYYIQGSDHYLIPKEEFEELLDRIDTAIRYIDCEGYDVYFKDEGKAKTLLQILKGEL